MADPTRRSTRFSMRSKQIGQLLLENGDVKAEQVAQALKVQEQKGGLIGQILQEMAAASMQAVAAALLKQVQVTDVKCEELVVPPDVTALVPRELCEVERLCPFERLGGLLCVVMGNPLNRKAITQVEERARLKVKSFKATWPKISELIQRAYGEAEAPPAPEEPAPAQAEGGGEVLTVEDAVVPPAADTYEAAPAPPPEAPAIVRSAARPSDSWRQRAVEAPAEAKVTGLDTMDTDQPEVIETTGRGLRRPAKKAPEPEEAPESKVEKKAKVNVDLDALDFTSAEVVAGADEGVEEMEEVAPAGAAPRPVIAPRALTGPMTKLKTVPDSYFYADGVAPPEGERAEELLSLLETLPVATVVAESIGDYQEQLKAKAPPPAKPAPKPIELEPAPAASLVAVAISEAEFNKLVASLGEDPVGEWDWQYAAPGPVSVISYDEN